MASGAGTNGTSVPVRPDSAGAGAEASVRVPHERAGVGLARHAFADRMTKVVGVSDETLDDAILVISELVSNAVKHAAPLRSGEIVVRWSVLADVLHLEITDGGAATRPNVGVAALSSLGGRGLDIVRSVSTQWGVTEGDESVTVWAEVPHSRERGDRH